MTYGEPRIRTADTLDAKKYRDLYRGHNLHIAIADQDSEPIEMQITIADLDVTTQQFSYANADLIEALLNLILQHEDRYSIEYLLEQIKRKSRTKSDLPGLIAKYLERHCREANKTQQSTNATHTIKN